MQNRITNNRYRRIGLILSLIAVPVIIYFYFLRWKTSVISNDDLSIYTTYLGLNGFYEKLNLPLLYIKYRPVQGLGIIFLAETFQKNLDGYYLFNVGVQTLIAFLLALNVNLFLRSPVYSLFVSLTVGLSRFCYYNITQLFNGGALEGLATAFFLASLFFILRILVDDADDRRKQKGIVLSIAFANLSLYTHERYLVMIPFIVLLILFFPGLKSLARRQKIILIFAALFSIALNATVKKYVYSIPFLFGTGNGGVSLSPFGALRSLVEAVLSVFQINTQAEYVFGFKFTSLPLLEKALTLLVASGLFLTLALFAVKTLKTLAFKPTDLPYKRAKDDLNLYIFLALSVLFVFLLVPAVITIRVEQRWLQAPFCVFVLMLAIAASGLRFGKSYIKNVLFSLLVILFIWTDYNYLARGYKTFYFQEATDRASVVKQAIDNGTIRRAADNLYIWERRKDAVREDGFRWSLVEGKFFGVYQDKSKKLFFIDSSDVKLNLDKNSDQVIFIDGDGVTDLTDFYLRDLIPEYYKKN